MADRVTPVPQMHPPCHRLLPASTVISATLQGVALLRVPSPYSFELSAERVRAFGPDLATVADEGALYRVFDTRETRLAPVPGGVDVDPPSAGVGRFLGLG